MKESIKSVTPTYSTHRMVQDYTDLMYVPCIERIRKIEASGYEMVRNLYSWKQNLESKWPEIHIVADRDNNGLTDLNALTGEKIKVGTIVHLGRVQPSNVKVELFVGKVENNVIVQGEAIEMAISEQIDSATYKYTGETTINDGGEYGYSFRVVPSHPDLFNKFDLPIIKWATN